MTTTNTSRRTVLTAVASAASGLLVVALLLLALGNVGRPAAGSGLLGTPEPAAQVSDLQTRVAVLSTQVATLGGADSEEIAARLGGNRAGFDAAFGPPAGYPAPNDVLYDSGDIGAVRVTFQDDRATVISVTPTERGWATPSTQPTADDWPIDTARQVVARLSPADATFEGQQEQPGVVTIPGTSAALAAAVIPPDSAGCPVSGVAAFRARVVMPTADTASSITMTVDANPTTLPASKPQRPKVERGANAVANSSIGGVVNVNGIMVQALQVRPNAVGKRTPAEGHSFLAVQLTIQNQSNRPLDYALADFALADTKGREIQPVCGGVDPAITSGTLAPGDTLQGWVTFQVPDNFSPQRMVFAASGARIGFTFR